MCALPELSCVTLKIGARHWPGSSCMLVLRTVPWGAPYLGAVPSPSPPGEEAMNTETGVQVTKWTERWLLDTASASWISCCFLFAWFQLFQLTVFELHVGPCCSCIIGLSQPHKAVTDILSQRAPESHARIFLAVSFFSSQ